MASPRRAHLTGTVLWSNSSNFDGFALLGIALPADVSSNTWPSVSMDETYPSQRLPQWTVIPIRAGAYDTNTTVFYSTDLEPPGCRYAAYFYDSNKKRIAPLVPASLFDITADPYTLVAPTLTVGTAATTAPSPDTGPTTSITPSTGTNIPSRETPVGIVDGANDTFTLSSSPTLLILTVDGQIQAPGVAYTLSGNTITFITVPTLGAVLEAFLW